MRYLNKINSKNDKAYVRFDYNIAQGNKYRDTVNKKINATINGMYFETPQTITQYIVTFFKCIIEGLIKQLNKKGL